VILLRLLRALVVGVASLLMSLAQLACSMLSCWLPLAIVALIVFALYRVTHG
jgi:hypothetical protein